MKLSGERSEEDEGQQGEGDGDPRHGFRIYVGIEWNVNRRLKGRGGKLCDDRSRDELSLTRLQIWHMDFRMLNSRSRYSGA